MTLEGSNLSIHSHLTNCSVNRCNCSANAHTHTDEMSQIWVTLINYKFYSKWKCFLHKINPSKSVSMNQTSVTSSVPQTAHSYFLQPCFSITRRLQPGHRMWNGFQKKKSQLRVIHCWFDSWAHMLGLRHSWGEILFKQKPSVRESWNNTGNRVYSQSMEVCGFCPAPSVGGWVEWRPAGSIEGSSPSF